MDFNPQDDLKDLAKTADEDIDLARAAIAIAALDQPGVSIGRYLNHLKKIGEEVAERYRELLEAGAEDNVETRLAALKHTIADKHGYRGDIETYDDLQNASLMRVIDRAKGLPVALTILYIDAARRQGWQAHGIDIPGHFLCRLDGGSERLIFDPFAECNKIEAHDLRALIKKALGAHAELSAHYFEPVGNRDILIRLQNNIKYRQIEAEDYPAALKTAQTMRLIDPEEYRLLLDVGVLYARTNQARAAIDALEEYIKRAPNDRDRHEAALLLAELKTQLN